MKKIFYLLFFAFFSAVGASMEYKEVPTAQKIKHKDLTFAVTFDNYSTRADLAKGKKDSLTMADVSFLLRGAVGFDRKQAYQPKTGESLIYSADRNINFKQGTLTMWVQAKDYLPGVKSPRGNIAYSQLRFTKGARYVQFLLYEYAGVLYFDWYSSEPPHRYGDVGRATASLAGIKKNEWFQVAVSWDKSLSLYINGVLKHKVDLPEKLSKSMDLVPDSKSFIGIKNSFHNDVHKSVTLVDDCMIYSRVLTALEVANQYNALCTGKNAAAVRNFDMKMHGVDCGKGKDTDKIEVEFDFISLPEKFAELYKNGKFYLDYKLYCPDKSVKSGRWNFKNGENTKFLHDVKLAGKYKLETSIGEITETAEVFRPDLSYMDKKAGDDDSVPAIWKDFAVNNRNVTLWNRKYVFGAGPLPEQIFIAGKPLFVKPPQLFINGQVVKNWQSGRTVKKNSMVTYSGETAIHGGRIKYNTTVEFDGMIKFDWTISGRPEIKSMKLEWQQSKGYHDYLMRPHVWNGKKGDFFYDNGMDNSLTELWMVSEKGGFAFTQANDANWVYDADKPIYHVNLKDGTASVDLITRKVKMPEDVPYSAIFIATPTRPFPEVFRSVRHNDNVYPGFRLTQHGGAAFTGNSTYKPNWRFGQYFRDGRPNAQGVYGMADAMTSVNEEPVYFAKYWEIPGDAGYTFSYRHYKKDGTFVSKKYNSLPTCNATSMVEFYTANIQELLNHPQSTAIGAIYYDLCGNGTCSNTLHGCGFKDKFGRDIKTFSLLHKRELLKRTVRLAHAKNKQLWTHAQRHFYPMLNGFADFVFPGEQFEALFNRTMYPFTDEIPELLFKTEFNRNIIGTGVICWSAITSLNRVSLPVKEKKRATEACESVLMLYDIDTNSVFAYNPVLSSIWDAQRRYKIHLKGAEFHRFDRQKEITSSDPKVRISYYTTPGNHTLIVVSNTDPMRAETTIDLGKYGKGLTSVREEYIHQDYPVVNGKVKLKVPARGFRLLGINPPAAEPWKLDYKTDVYTGGQNSVSQYIFDSENKIHTIRKKDSKNYILTAFFPVRPGYSYTLNMECKQTAGKNISWTMQPQYNGNDNKMIASVGKVKGTGTWQKVSAVKNVTVKDGKRCYAMLFTLGTPDVDTEVSFRNITVTEKAL
ncbi:MAG: LamG domain-containing protein [Lentisphaeria bacterium]|nr:LamG domain-containing protein [Lentisphaeria bacterium]